MFRSGDQFHVSDAFDRRTFWQWLARKPKRLTLFTCTAEVTADGRVAPHDTPQLLADLCGPMGRP